MIHEFIELGISMNPIRIIEPINLVVEWNIWTNYLPRTQVWPFGKKKCSSIVFRVSKGKLWVAFHKDHYTNIIIRF